MPWSGASFRTKHNRKLSKPAASAESLAAFVRELGLEDEMREARKELAAQIQECGPKAFGLKVLRLKAGLSQAELAKAIGTSQSRVSLLESGREGMSFAFARGMTLKAWEKSPADRKADAKGQKRMARGRK